MILTGAAKKKQQQISMVLEPEGGKDSDKEEEKPASNPATTARNRRTAVLTDRLRNEASTEEKRKRHQQELAEMINERALERLNRNKGEVAEPRLRKSNVAYKRAADFPADDEVKELKIFVDKKNETLVRTNIWVMPESEVSSGSDNDNLVQFSNFQYEELPGNINIWVDEIRLLDQYRTNGSSYESAVKWLN